MDSFLAISGYFPKQLLDNIPPISVDNGYGNEQLPSIITSVEQPLGIGRKMSGIIGDNKFTAQHHALLFTSISKQVINQLGKKKGKQLLRKAVRRYGQQRGQRMALRLRKMAMS